MSLKSGIFCILFILFSLSVIHLAEAQKEFIVIEKTLSNKQIKYSSGDAISYKLKDEDFFRTDHIVALNDTSIEFHYNTIPYADIAQVDIRGHRFANMNIHGIGTYAQIVGIAYIAVDQFNQVVVRGEDASFNEGVWIAGGTIFLGGTIMKLLTPKKLKLGGKYRIRYMNLNYK
jgi:ABC-type polysaccharide transport system permease subunit